MANLYTRSNYDATKNGQIVIESHQFGTVTDFQPERVMASVAEAADRQYSYVMVTTKALPDVLSTPKLLEPFLLPSYRYPQPTYVLLQNGLGVETDLHAKLVDRIISPSPRIITAAVYCDANLVGRIMKHPSGKGFRKPRLELGLFTPAHAAPAQVELSEPNLAIFRSMVDAGGGCATISEDIQAAKFRKNIWNAVFATFSCLTRVPPSFYVATPALWEKVVPLLRETGEEVVAVGRALGYSEKYLPSDVIQSFINGDVATYNEVESQLMPSTVLDIKANKPFEVEVIVALYMQHRLSAKAAPAMTPSIAPPSLADRSTISMEEVLVVGWGAVGILFGYILHHSGKVRLTVVARSNYQAAKNGQIHINSHQFGTVTDFKPERAEAADRQYAFVVVAAKALPDVLPTSKLLEPFLSLSYTFLQPTYVLLQNGLGVETDLYQSLEQRKSSPSPHIITTAVYCAANLIGNAMQHPANIPKLELGFFPPKMEGAKTTEVEPNLVVFQSLIEAGGGVATIEDNIQAVKFRKNIWNAAFAPMSCFTRVPPAFYTATPALWEKVVPLLRETGEEIVAVGRALGYSEIYLPADVVEGFLDWNIATFKDVKSQHKPSTLLDIEVNKPFEVEAIVGEVVRAGKRLGVPIPKTEAIYIMLSVMQAHNLKTLD
ncbi:hypothetical protein FRB98_007155 [Tulasnella sp. 332]|nr:hypothetical protein FRB98_007155 [Tulasnella sp. 332]